MSSDAVDIRKTLSNMDASQKIILYCIGALGEPIKNQVKIQKTIFLSSKSLPEIFEDEYTFQKHKKGPYSEKIDEDISVIRSEGYISGSDFNLSNRGRKVYNAIELSIRDPLKSVIQDSKKFVVGLTDDELLTFIYTLFPEYTEDSEVWENLKSNRVKNAVSMLKKGKITASRAAEIAGMNYYDFEDYLRKLKIRWKS
jgi:uncharacterized protein YwgA